MSSEDEASRLRAPSNSSEEASRLRAPSNPSEEASSSRAPSSPFVDEPNPFDADIVPSSPNPFEGHGAFPTPPRSLGGDASEEFYDVRMPPSHTEDQFYDAVRAPPSLPFADR